MPEGLPAECGDGSAGAAVAGLAADRAAVGKPEAGLERATEIRFRALGNKWSTKMESYLCVSVR